MQDKNIINLDSSYSISLKNLTIDHLPEYDMTVAKDKRLKSKVQVDHLAGDVARAFGIQNAQIEQLENLACQRLRDWSHLRSQILPTIPP